MIEVLEQIAGSAAGLGLGIACVVSWNYLQAARDEATTWRDLLLPAHVVLLTVGYVLIALVASHVLPPFDVFIRNLLPESLMLSLLIAALVLGDVGLAALALHVRYGNGEGEPDDAD